MHHFETEMCTHVHISVTKWCIVGYRTGALWDLHNRSISSPKLTIIMGWLELVRGEVPGEFSVWSLINICHCCAGCISVTWGISPSSHSWRYYPGTLPCSQVTATHLKIGHPYMKSMGVQFSNELHWLDFNIGHQDSSPSTGHQGVMLNWTMS